MNLTTNQRLKNVRLPDGTRSVQSPWVWRGFFLMSLIALGLCISFIAGHKAFYAGAWAVITIGWFAISMWLWRRHVVHENAEWSQRVQPGRARPAAAVTPARRGGHVDSGGHVR